jgi:ATP/maltotriose-dependent transcriptional regulator MalT
VVEPNGHQERVVVAAIPTIYPDSCQDISEYLRMTAVASPEDLAGAQINDLDQIDERFTLVLDDYHHLGDATSRRP